MLSLLFAPAPTVGRKSDPTGLTARISSFASALSRWHRRRVTIRSLQALDDRTLKDIGVDRSEIASAVYCGREALTRLPSLGLPGEWR